MSLVLEIIGGLLWLAGAGFAVAAHLKRSAWWGEHKGSAKPFDASEKKLMKACLACWLLGIIPFAAASWL